MAGKEIVPSLPAAQAAFTATLVPQTRCDYAGCKLLVQAVQNQCACQAALAVAVPSRLNREVKQRARLRPRGLQCSSKGLTPSSFNYCPHFVIQGEFGMA